MHQHELIRCNKKLKFYSTFKTDVTPSNSLELITNLKHRRAVAKLRVGNHNLRIETGRHSYPKLPEHLRICQNCSSNEIENKETLNVVLPLNTEWSYLKMPYVSERLNYKIANIFRKEGIPVRVTHKSYTLRRALSQNNTERTCTVTCTRANCPISNTNLCLLRNVVYQITCNNCNQHYIGSTTRFVHDRVREHLNNDSSSVKKHISKCQNKVHKDIKVKTIALEKDPANLLLFEAYYIRKYKPALNSREECSEFADLLF